MKENPMRASLAVFASLSAFSFASAAISFPRSFAVEVMRCSFKSVSVRDFLPLRTFIFLPRKISSSSAFTFNISFHFCVFVLQFFFNSRKNFSSSASDALVASRSPAISIVSTRIISTYICALSILTSFAFPDMTPSYVVTESSLSLVASASPADI